MGEFMLRVLNQADHSDTWPQERHRAFLAACETYIGELQRAGQLIAAQPLARTGAIVATRAGAVVIEPLQRAGELQVGYYHLRCANLDEAIAIATRNPELAYSETARVEVRPLKTIEADTSFDYPTH